ncbi:MAG: hypothetical protein LV473_00955 [Nitrospira sp.]|nr:hypothetical protein [Nitrospira sp.]
MCSKITILFLVFAAGCATESRRLDMLLLSRAIERRCGPESDIQHTGLRMPLAQKSSLARTDFGVADLPAGRFSSQSQDIAGTIGTKNLLAQIAALEAESARNVPDFAIQLLLVRQQLSDRILLALLDVKSAAAEANCEEKRADQLADQLQEIRDARARRLTIFAVLVGGVAGILSGGLAAADPSSITGGLAAIAAGVVASAFGAAALFDDPRYEFQHGRNLLREVWEGQDQPSLFPVSVWRFLNRPLRDDPAQRSLREILLTSWLTTGRLGEPDSEVAQRRVALFFGSGGSYQIEDLRARAAMMDLLEAEIDLMSHDLERLMQEALFDGAN